MQQPVNQSSKIVDIYVARNGPRSVCDVGDRTRHVWRKAVLSIIFLISHFSRINDSLILFLTLVQAKIL